MCSPPWLIPTLSSSNPPTMCRRFFEAAKRNCRRESGSVKLFPRVYSVCSTTIFILKESAMVAEKLINTWDPVHVHFCLHYYHEHLRRDEMIDFAKLRTKKSGKMVATFRTIAFSKRSEMAIWAEIQSVGEREPSSTFAIIHSVADVGARRCWRSENKGRPANCHKKCGKGYLFVSVPTPFIFKLSDRGKGRGVFSTRFNHPKLVRLY
ncbi:hypothetical protein K1719_043229 [Acacia pycnantha]|nr:hypothetical protein K1719_043229 [Acacia pycnantha]